ncbi:hypothetical protein ACFP3I_16535 [Chryseobacterium arachidis]|uniref:hypothetical protein n=1 Tax=Chryseobacterium arachidis TaxID=1416778 RepID=UPI00361F2175
MAYNTFLILIVLSFFSCSKKENKFDNPIFSFFHELNDKNVDSFMKSYYSEKPDYVLSQYRIVLNQLKNSDITITDYNHYEGEKINIDGDTKNIFIISHDQEIITSVKVEDKKVKYLLSINKGKELIGWL